VDFLSFIAAGSTATHPLSWPWCLQDAVSQINMGDYWRASAKRTATSTPGNTGITKGKGCVGRPTPLHHIVS
jgi:hypothetical protein